MSQATILVVEDESIVGMDLLHRLMGLGYSVPAVAACGRDAIKKADEYRPDLVLMDIRLRGEMDGIEVAEQILDLFDIPPVYLTAYTDEDTLERAKITHPFGYVVKPFDERTLRSTIEMALFRCKTERRLRESEEWLAATLECVSDAVAATNARGQIVFMNPSAEALTGWTQKESTGKTLTEVFDFLPGDINSAHEDLVARVRQNGSLTALDRDCRLVARDGQEISVTGNVAPIRDLRGGFTGVVLSLRRWDPGAPQA